MEHHHRKYWLRWENRALLALEGALIGVFSASVICSFRFLYDHLSPFILQWLAQWKDRWWIAPLWLLILVLAARFLGYLVQHIPLISGSGIPQTELVICNRLHIPRKEWLRVLAGKFTACLTAILCGLSLGRAAPCIQMGAAAAAVLSGVWERFTIHPHIPVSAGSAAGLAAAFGSPFAGFFFVFEEMKTRVTIGGVLAVLSAVASAEAVTCFAFGYETIFPFQNACLPLSQLWLIIPTGLITGAAGVLYSKALIGGKNIEARFTPLPQSWRILPPMLAAFAVSLTLPSLMGGGEYIVHQLGILSGDPISLLKSIAVLTLLKLSYSVFSYTGNVPGGIIMPTLCLGALMGALCGQAFHAAGIAEASSCIPFLLFGMAGFFSSMMRTPLTSIAIVMELSGAWACLPGTILTATIAFFTANALKVPPIYETLRSAIVVHKKRPGK